MKRWTRFLYVFNIVSFFVNIIWYAYAVPVTHDPSNLFVAFSNFYVVGWVYQTWYAK